MLGKGFLLALVALLALRFADCPAGETAESRRAEARRQKELGNHRNAAGIYRDLALSPDSDIKQAVLDLREAETSLLTLRLPAECEAMLRKAIDSRPESWRMLMTVADLWRSLPSVVDLVDGEHVRTHNWPRSYLNAAERDRAFALQLMLRAEKLLDTGPDAAGPGDKYDFYRTFANLLSLNRINHAPWRFTALTDLDTLPDYQSYDQFFGGRSQGAPVDGDGTPVFYPLPPSWGAARNDGERWRWLLGRYAEFGGADGAAQADAEFAHFLLLQFGVQTMGTGRMGQADDGGPAATGPFAVRTLTDGETIAKLATGLKRFPLPDEFNHIRLYKRLSDRRGGHAATATKSLAQIYENRQQFHKAVAMWQTLRDSEPRNSNLAREAAASLARITGKNGMLEAGPVAPAGKTTTLSYLFRNGSKVSLTAHRLDEKKLLADIRRSIKADSEEVYKNPAIQRPDQIGRAVVEQGATKYILEKTAEWDVDLQPLEDYYSSRATIALPFSEAGCYLVEAAMDNGNTSRVVLWLADLALVRKPLGAGQLFYLADAVTGAPVPDATVSFLGYATEFFAGDQPRRRTVSEFAETTDKNGLVLIDSQRMDNRDWLVRAEAPDGRYAYIGFDHIWSEQVRQAGQDRVSSFIVTDRPVYRPDQKINFKIWLGNITYSDKKPSASSVAGRAVTVSIINPMGQSIYSKNLTTDDYGGIDDTLVLDGNAPLGVYSIQADTVDGYGSFRLEEYRKPEFEVTVQTPDKALVLGDTTEIKVKADYYFGAPVANARITYKVSRSVHNDVWYPTWRWDWLYGRGSSWLAYDYTWYPGWSEWGVYRPGSSWLPPVFVGQPELVAEGEARLDDDGVFRLPIDTAPAKAMFGDRDHKYDITVEVTDASRRVIVGSGRVVATRKPFTTTVWADRGYYRTDQEIAASVMASLPLGGGVKTTGKAVLHRVRYDDRGTPSESEVESRDIETDASGAATFRLKAGAPGQYRLACTLRDEAGNTVEGAVMLTVRGPGGEGDFRFTSLELVPDRAEYAPGDTVKLAVNSENPEARVLFLPMAERWSSAFMKPQLVSLKNGTALLEVDVGPDDRPNFFCEAITVFDGHVHSEVREIHVPPVAKALNVEVTPGKEQYLPGEKAEFQVRVTDADGKPVAGECVVSVYDRSVEYIAGGSNVGDILAHFWSWKRSYHGRTVSSLERHGYRAMKRGDVLWEPIGIFGGQEADWNDDGVYLNGRAPAGGSVRFRGGKGLQDETLRMASVPAPPAPMAAASVAMEMPAQAMGMAKAESKDMAFATEADTGAGPLAEAVVRGEFADTALWIASLVTDEKGEASFTVDMPENLTAWKARTWVMGSETRVGSGEALVETKKNVIIRPQAPRFLTQKDRVILTANVHNYLPRAKTARVELVLEGGLLVPAAGVELTKTVSLAAGGEERVDWLVEVRRPGEARIVMKLLTDEESDAAEITLPVVVHGSRTVESFGGALRNGEKETTILLRVPEERLPDQSRLELTFSPSIAVGLLDALPFLIEYPYGCTEQTLNRFLPVVMTRKYLDRLGLSLADAHEAGQARNGDPQSVEWAARFGGANSRARLPVFDDEELAKMVRAGVERLSAMQTSDGGWGWFSGSGERSWPHTTSVVVNGLLTARECGVAIPADVIDEGIAWLRGHQDRQVALLKRYLDTDGKEGKARPDDQDAFIHQILARQGRFNPDMRDFLYQDREHLSLSGLAMLGLAMQAEKADNFLEVVLQNLEQYLEEDDNGTAWLRTPATGWWWWYNDSVETQAWYLKLLARTDPKGERTAGVAKYLLRNRKNGHYWRSTRDTAYAIEALTEFAAASGETAPDMTVSVYLDGDKVMERRLGPDNLLDDNRFLLEGLAVETGDHQLRIVQSGTGNLYYGGSLDLFSLEDPIPAAGGDMTVGRTYFKLVREDGAIDARTATGTAASTKVEKYRRVRLPSPFDTESAGQARLEPGDLIEVELTVETKNDYEYLVFEDMKAAGIEAVELISGYTANALGAYIEYRDQKVVLFVRSLPRGKYSVSYRFRAETPGFFSALPVFGGGMYATDLFANSNEQKVEISEEGVFEGGR